MILFGCNTNQNYDKSLLPNAEPATFSKVNSKILVSCMQVPVPQPPIPINESHKVANKQMYDSNDCFDNKVAENETKKINNEKKENKKFKLDINLKDQDNNTNQGSNE